MTDMMTDKTAHDVEAARLGEIEAWGALTAAIEESRRIAAVEIAARAAWWKARETTRNLGVPHNTIQSKPG